MLLQQNSVADVPKIKQVRRPFSHGVGMHNSRVCRLQQRLCSGWPSSNEIERPTYCSPNESRQTELHGEGYDARIVLPWAH